MGIGTARPKAKLEVVGAKDILAKGKVSIFKDTATIQGTGTDFNQIHAGDVVKVLYTYGETPWKVVTAVEINNEKQILKVDSNFTESAANADLHYKHSVTRLGDQSGDPVIVNALGNVGIGTDKPQAKLEVNGDVKVNRIGTNGFNPDKGYPTNWGGGVHTWDVYAEGTIAAGKGGNVNSYIGNDGSGYFASYLRIGNISPQAKLDVMGDIKINGKGIIRSNSVKQQKMVITHIEVKPGTLSSFSGKECFYTFSESFSSPPAYFLGNLTSGGGFANIILTPCGPSTSGFSIWVYNASPSASNAVFSINVIAIGDE